MQKIFFRTPLLYSREEKSPVQRNSGGVVKNNSLDTKSQNRRLAKKVNCLSEALEKCKSDLSAENSQCLTILFYNCVQKSVIESTIIKIFLLHFHFDLFFIDQPSLNV